MSIKEQTACREGRSAVNQLSTVVGAYTVAWFWKSSNWDVLRYNVDINVRMVVVWDLNNGAKPYEL